MKFIVRAQLPPALARRLVACGDEAEHVVRQILRRHGPQEIKHRIAIGHSFVPAKVRLLQAIRFGVCYLAGLRARDTMICNLRLGHWRPMAPLRRSMRCDLSQGELSKLFPELAFIQRTAGDRR